MGQRHEVAGLVTSRRSGGAARAGGFTLFEVIVTLFVLALALGLALPILGRTSETLQARAHVAGFAAMLRHAREKAITTHRPHAVVVDPAAQRVRIVTGRDEVREMRPLPERVRVEAASTAALTVRFEPEGTSSGADFRVASGGVAYRVTVDPVTGRVRSRRE